MPTFRAKARAVDLLGKGQIADLPTAISELWKNGYDAYADNVGCAVFTEGYEGLKKSVFVLVDDGHGMQEKDILEKWIVLGTDSKIGSSGIKETTLDDRLGKPLRPIAGEKGIGRLSVAYLGSQMLMISKKPNMKPVVVFMHWDILNNFDLYLDQVNIPIRKLNSVNELPDMFVHLKEDFIKNFSLQEWDGFYSELKSRILSDIENLDFPELIIKEILDKYVGDDKHGTAFVIFNPHEMLLKFNNFDTLDTKDQSDMQELRASLVNFHNPFLVDNHKVNLNTFFDIYRIGGKRDYIEKTQYFSRDDFEFVDHHIKGYFDSNGFFSGKVRVFNQVEDHFFTPKESPGKTDFGPFEIEFGYIEGEPKKTSLNNEKLSEYKKKLLEYGGLLIFRDNLRVLPYGRVEYDYLGFEERRSRGASYHFFSYRRMFGYIGITRAQNEKLKDKAGREGFISTGTYRAFISLLKSFFLDLSVKYFYYSENSRMPTLRKISLDERKQATLEIEKKKSEEAIDHFRSELKSCKANFEQVSKVIKEPVNKLKTAIETKNIKPEELRKSVAELEEQILSVKKLNRLEEPKRAILPDHIREDFLEYQEKIEAFVSNTEIEDVLVKSRKLLEKPELLLQFENETDQMNREIESIGNEFVARLKHRFAGWENEIRNGTSDLKRDFSKILNSYPSVNGMDNDSLSLLIRDVRKEYDLHFENYKQRFEPFISHLEQLDTQTDEDLLFGHYKTESKKLQEKLDTFYELAQLGMAIEIIDHQFNVLYGEMADSMKFFKKIAAYTPTIRQKFNQLNNAFEQLESNHQLLTPLFRTTRRAKTEIKGSSISYYLRTFFNKTFDRQKIKLVSDESFEQFSIRTYESVIKPVFVNIINNAIYWLLPSDDRKIEIKYENDNILIRNSGEKISKADLERIFELFFSKRPGGRGIGLYLAKTNLRTIGYDIYATNEPEKNTMGGACFVISKTRK